MTGKVRAWGMLWLVAWALPTWGLDSSRLWLPVQYQQAMPQLEAAARLAENAQRCERVINGKLLVSKSSESHYYFLVTCRDSQARTYNLSYKVPVAGGPPMLVAEQRSGGSPGLVGAEGALSLTTEQAVEVCKTEFPAAVDTLDEVHLLESEIGQVIATDSGFEVSLPFTAQSDLGNRIRYSAGCQVSSDGNTQFVIALQPEGALVICRDQLRSESILLGRATFLENKITRLPSESGFQFNIPFDVRTLAIDAVRYLAHCSVNVDSDAELKLFLQPEGAFAICKQALATETLLMKGVVIDQEPEKLLRIEDRFEISLAFDANSPDGNPRQFRAACHVDAEGEATVETALDKSAIVAVCVHGVRDSASNMIDVQVLENELPPLREDGEGYFAEIPFDARDPAGRLLHYKGECRVDEAGRTKVKLKPRYLR